MQRFLVPAFFATSLVVAPAITLVGHAPASGGPVLVIAAHADAIIRRAGGRQVGLAAAPLGSLAASSDPEFPRRLRQGGAWLVLDGSVLASICGASA